MKSIVLVCVSICSLFILESTFAPFPLAQAGVAEQAPQPFRVVSTVFDVNNSTGHILTIANVNNLTKFSLSNASESNTVLQGYSQISITFPEVDFIVDGDKYKACSIVVKLMAMQCKEGYKSPGIRDGSVSFSISDISSYGEPLLR